MWLKKEARSLPLPQGLWQTQQGFPSQCKLNAVRVQFDDDTSAIYLFLAEKGYIAGRIAPIAIDNSPHVEDYINPIPSGLVLTGIVVSVSVTALMLSLTIRLYKRYHTLDLDEISQVLKREG